MTTVTARSICRPVGSSGSAYEVEVTPESAGWGYSSLRIVSLAAAGSIAFATGDDEMIVVPLRGGVAVEVGRLALSISTAGRTSSPGRPTSPTSASARSSPCTPNDGGRFALCGARTDRSLPAALPARGQGAGRAARGRASPAGRCATSAPRTRCEASKIIACEVITPGGNWSSYPAHKHDQASEHESELEEIYYFEIAAGPDGEPGFGFMRTSSSPGKDDRHPRRGARPGHGAGPYGWHGPCCRGPGFDMYYLNVMAGPAAERAWKISDHPDQSWVRDTWADPADRPSTQSEKDSPA